MSFACTGSRAVLRVYVHMYTNMYNKSFQSLEFADFLFLFPLLHPWSYIVIRIYLIVKMQPVN